MEPILDLMDEVGLGGWEFLHLPQTLRFSASFQRMANLPYLAAENSLTVFSQHLHEADRFPFLNAFQESMAGLSGSLSIVVRIVHSDNREHKVLWLSFRGRVLERDDEGKPLRSQGIVIDLTAEKTFETSLLEERQRFRNFIEFLPLPLCHTDAGEHMGYVNARFSATFGYTRDDIPNLQAWWLKAFPDSDYRQHAMAQWRHDVLLAKANDVPIEPREYQIICKDGSPKSVAISGIALGSDFLTTFVDISAYQSERQILEFSNFLLGEISKNQPLKEVLQHLVDEMYKLYPLIHLSICLLDDDERQLHPVVGSTPTSYDQMLDGRIFIGENVGSCGAAAFWGREVFVGDIATHPNWVGYRDLALSHGLRACWATPLKTQNGRVLGTFAVYFEEPCQIIPDALREWVNNLSALALIAIEVNKRNEELATFSGTLLRAETIGQIGSWSYAVKSALTVWSKQLYEIMGFNPELGQPEFTSFIQRVHPDDAYRLQALFSQMVSGRDPDEVVAYRYFLPNGEMRYLQPQVLSFKDKNGKIVRYEGTVQDVTESKKKELRLVAQLDELRRWQEVMLNRETRILELKGQVNQLLALQGKPPRYEHEISPEGGSSD